MTTSRRRAAKLVALLAALALVAAACGDDETTDTATDDGAETAEGGDASGDEMDESMEDDSMDDMEEGEHDGEHDHGDVLEVPDGMAVPEVGVRLAADPKSGVNVFVELANFDISPENASTDPVDGEGHLHLYVNGERTMRFYNTELHLDDLGEGEHEITVEVSANNHSPYAVDGEAIQATETITVEASEHSHGDADQREVDAADAPTVAITAVADPKSGWNLEFETTNLDISAEAASTEHVDGQGHLHLYVDGERQGRIYGNWWHLASLTEGDHEVTIEASANDHAAYAVDGEPIRATTTISVTAEQAAAAGGHSHGDDEDGHDEHGDDEHGEHGDDEHGAMEDAVKIDVSVTGDTVDVASDRIEVPLGSSVVITAVSDRTDHVHLHGYDILTDLEAGVPGELTFVADVPGVFEVELEDVGLFLFEIAVE